MKLSAPLYHLKRRAKALSRAKAIPLHQALDLLAREEGINSWSLLVARISGQKPEGISEETAGVASAQNLLSSLIPGDLLLLGARPGHGKTRKGLELIVEALKQGRHGVFFTFEYNKKDIEHHFAAIVTASVGEGGSEEVLSSQNFVFENSDNISAAYIMKRLASAEKGTVAVIDYLQLLDQKRDNPELSVQITALRSFARERGVILVFLSQIDRSFELTGKPCPDLEDVRLPNPLDLGLFDRTCFMNREQVQIGTIPTSATGRGV
ncbi:DNA helicase [Kiloniella laminariae]|uniref:DNA helicase n=1 Tax=Kiloniella laminariae TaxID=454162 RepID=A0ABT4LF74_9PROT|nr:DNA helicase [Kiloniella laminariae]MCZ4279738.1 DNA helicase [Kiloniella laminariae]